MNTKKYTQANLSKESEPIEYVIYCRKSTDESSEKQVASIGRQIAECTRYAERENLILKEKPKNFPFETDEDIFKEDHDEDKDDRVLYQETRKYFIVKEQHSAKSPGRRKKWAKLVKMIQSGEIRGLLSYSPDRQSRNMLEGGEIIDFVDRNLTELRYTNFHFEPTASGKMMLGIWFVFSKQYSDKLSEDVSAGNSRKLSKKEGLGAIKHGYAQDKNMKWIPDPVNFEIVQWAFETKIEKKWSDRRIAEEMNQKGFRRILKSTGEIIQMDKQKLNRIWTDPFYYGLWIRADEEVDLRDEAGKYIPMISIEEHEVLCERHKNYEERLKRQVNIEDELESIRVVGNNFIQDKTGDFYTLTLPNRKSRHEKKLIELQKTIPEANLGDIVTPSQIIFNSGKTKKKINFDIVEKAILKKMSELQITQEQYKAYLLYAKKKIKEDISILQVERRKAQILINSISSKRRKYIEANMESAGKRSIDEEKIYQEKKENFDNSLQYYENKISQLNTDENKIIFDIETMVDFVRNAVEYYKKASYVQKASIINILFLNATVNNKKSLTLAVKPQLESLFVIHGRRDRT